MCHNTHTNTHVHAQMCLDQVSLSRMPAFHYCYLSSHLSPFLIPPEKQLAWDSGTSVVQSDRRLCCVERILFRCPTFKIELHPHHTQYYGPSGHSVLPGPGSLPTHWPPDLTLVHLTSSSTQLPLRSSKIINVMVSFTCDGVLHLHLPLASVSPPLHFLSLLHFLHSNSFYLWSYLFLFISLGYFLSPWKLRSARAGLCIFHFCAAAPARHAYILSKTCSVLKPQFPQLSKGNNKFCVLHLTGDCGD